MTGPHPGERDEATGSGPPPTPAGYAEPYRFEYSMLVLFALAVPMTGLAVGGFAWLLRRLQGPGFLERVATVTVTPESTAISVDLLDVAGPFLVGLLVVVVVHELVHGAVMRAQGMRVTYGVAPVMGAFYTSAFGQFQRREALVPVALAPLVVITLVGLPLLALPYPAAVLATYVVLVVNAAGAVGDIYVIWRVARMPPGTLLYDVDLRHWYVFEPIGDDTDVG